MMPDGIRKKIHMDKKEAARQRLQLRRAKTNSHAGSGIANIAEFDRACMYVSILLGISFGLMFFVGLI